MNRFPFFWTRTFYVKISCDVPECASKATFLGEDREACVRAAAVAQWVVEGEVVLCPHCVAMRKIILGRVAPA